MYIILKAVYFMLPAYFANMMPIFSKRINFLNYPVDFNKKLFGKSILGSHKTYRGFFFGIIGAIVIAYVQFLLSRFTLFSNISLLDYSNWLVIGFLIGFGALFGDSVKSFFKRRVGVAPGKPFIPWDQIDYSVGSLLLISIIYIPSWDLVIAVIVINFILHITANHIGYYIGIRKVKW